MSKNNSVDPGIFPLLLFGYSLLVLGAELLVAPQAAGALVFAIFIAGVAQTLGGLWEISRAKNYLGSVLATFGIWLLGLFLLQTLGRSLGMVTPQTSAVYFLVLLVPILLLGIPAFKHAMPWPIRGAFVALFLLVLAAGLNFLLANDALRVAAGAFALLAALCIWTLAAEHIAAAAMPQGEEGSEARSQSTYSHDGLQERA